MSCGNISVWNILSPGLSILVYNMTQKTAHLIRYTGRTQLLEKLAKMYFVALTGDDP